MASLFKRAARSESADTEFLQATMLEQRVMLSATPIADAALDAESPTQPATDFFDETSQLTVDEAGDSGVAGQQQRNLELVVIDPTADDWEMLLADLQAQEGRNFDVLILDPDKDGIEQISDRLEQLRGVSAIHLVSHGEAGEIQLGTSTLDVESLQRYASQLAGWQHTLSADADLLIYGCDLAASESGVELTESLSLLTGADVAASTNDTGHAFFGGDWVLEHHVGAIETEIAFTATVQQNWANLLNVTIDDTSTGTAAAGSNSRTVLHTTSGSERLMLVGISFGQNNGDSVSSVTYKGDNLTFVGARQSGSDARMEIWSLVAPDTGFGSVSVSFSGTNHEGATIGVMTFNGVSQTAALGAFSSNDGDSNAITTNLTGDGELVFAVAAFNQNNDQNFVAGTGQTERWDLNRDKANGTGTTQAGGAGVTASWSVSDTDKWAAGGVAIRSARLEVDTTSDVLDGDTSSIYTLMGNRGADGFISLREAIIATNNTAGADEITLAAGNYTLTIGGTGENSAATGDLDINDDLTIIGTGADSTTINGASLDRVFHLRNSAAVTMSGITITGGFGDDGAGIYLDGATSLDLSMSRIVGNNSDDNDGGGLHNKDGVVTLTDVSITGNTAGTATGGGLRNEGQMTLERVTISGNSAKDGGGIISRTGGSLLTMINTTISGNTAADKGGGIETNRDVNIINSTIANNIGEDGAGINDSGGTVTIANTIFAGNTRSDLTSENLVGTLISNGYNIDSDGTGGFAGTGDLQVDPQLLALADNGGFTQTHALQDTSAAIDAGTATGAPTTDQRGQDRIGFTDIGAYEYLATVASTNAFTVNQTTTGIQETSGETRGSQKAVAISPNGDYTVVWSSNQATGGDTDGYAVYMRSFDKTGTPLTAETLVNQTTAGDQQWARIAAAYDGTYVVTWTSGASGSEDVYMRRYDANGAALSNEILVNNTTSGSQRNSDIAMNPATGDFVVAWQGNGPGDTNGIFYRRFAANGTPLDSADLLGNPSDNGTEANVSVASNAAGDFILAWENGSNLYVRRFDAAGNQTLAQMQLPGTSSPSRPAIALRDDGQFVVAARSDSIIDKGTYVRAFDSDGSALTSWKSVQTGDRTSPSIAMDSSGNYAIVFEGSTDGDGKGVRAKIYNADHTEYQTIDVNTTTTGDQHLASVAMLSVDNLVFVWSGQGTGDTDGVFARQSPTSSIGSPVAVDDSDSTVSGTQVTINLTGNDTDPLAGGLSVLDVSTPANGTVVNNLDGTVTYTPDSGFSGSDTFNYIVSDGRDGMTHFWNLNGDGNDSIGSAHGTVSGGVTTIAGAYGSALEFDEVDGHVQTSDITYNNEFTVSFKFQITDNTGPEWMYMYSHGDATTVNSLNIMYGENGNAGFDGHIKTVFGDVDDAYGLNALVFDASSAMDGNWHTYTLTVDATNGSRVYLDGTLMVSDSARGGDAFDPTGDLYFGTREDLDPIRFFGGGLDSVAVFERSLDATEVSALSSAAYSSDATSQAQVTVSVSNTAPTVDTGQSFNVSEAAADLTSLGFVTASDADGTTTFSNWTITGGNTGSVFAINSSTGELTVADNTNLDYETLQNYTLSITVSDGTNTSSVETVAINVTDVNDRPVVSNLSGDTLNYTVGTGVQRIEQGSDVTVGDVDSPDFAGGNLTVSVAAGADNSEDVLSINNEGSGGGQIGFDGTNVTYGGVQIGTASGGSVGAPLVVNLNASATPVATAALIRNITYENIDVAAPTAGTRTVRFVVNDGDGASSLDHDTTVHVSPASNNAPTANAGGPYTIAEGGTLNLNASASSDLDTDPLTFAWDLDNDGNYGEVGEPTTELANVNWSTLQSFGINDDGVYTIGVQADDGNGGVRTATATLTVTNVAPVLNVTGAVAVGAGQSYTLNLSAIDPGSDTISQWHIDWGDGTVETVPGNSTSVNHTYTQAGFTRNIVVSATDEDGTWLPSTLFVTDAGNDQLVGFDADSGASTSTTFVFDSPTDVTVGPDGNLYVTNFLTNDIERYDPATGNLIDIFIYGGSGNLGQPSRIAFASDGSLMVTSNATNEVLRYGNDGRFLGSFIAAGSGLDAPDGIAFGPNGNLYVANNNGGNILEFDGTTGTFLRTFASFGSTGFIDLNFDASGHLFASHSALNVIREFDAGGAVVGDVVTAASGIVSAGGFTWAPNGRLYVADFGGNRVMEYQADGTLIGEFVPPTSGLNAPINLTFTPMLQVYVDAPATALNDSYTVNEGGTLNTNVITDWFNASWKYRQQITFDNSAQGSSLAEMPVLVKLHATAADALNIDYSKTRDAGQDLRFTDSAGNVLNHEIESWDELGYSYVWVRVPNITGGSTSDFVWMYYGHEKVSDGHTTNAVWDSDHVAVLHLDDASTDSSSFGNDGNVTNTFTTPGITGGAALFDGSTSEINLGSDASLDNIFSGGGTISTWINASGWGENGFGRIADKASTTFGANGDGWAFQVGGIGTNGYLLFEHGFSGTYGEWRTPTGSLNLNTWQHVAVVYDNSSAANDPLFYIDGVLQTTILNIVPIGTMRSDAALDLKIGNHSAAATRTFDGVIDEFRISNSSRSADEIAAHFQSVDGTFASAVAAVNGPGGVLSNDSDREGDNLAVTLVSGPAHAASFAFNSDGSFSYVHDGSETTTDSFTYQVSDGNGGLETATVSLTITPQNDAPTDISLSSNIVAENSDGAIVGTLATTDPDVSDTHTYSVSDARFEVVGNQLKLRDGQVLDFETEPSVNLTVTSTDSGSLTTNRSFVLTVQDSNDELPVVTAGQSFSVSETAPNNTSVGTVVASDADAGTTFSNWAIVSGNLGAAFAIDSSSGEITVLDTAAIDFESATSFTLGITVSDGVRTSAIETVTINVIDQNDEAPVVNSGQSFNVSESAINGTLLGTVVASDPDAGTTFSNWMITGGNTGGIFAINSGTGELTVADNTNLDFETLQNYTLSITVRDGVHTSAVQTIAISVNDANDNVPVIGTGQSFNVSESAANSTSLGFVAATDADAGTTFSDWKITGGNSDGIFAINSSTGELTVADNTNLDYETLPNYTLSITVSDGINTAAVKPVAISVGDVNDSPPVTDVVGNAPKPSPATTVESDADEEKSDATEDTETVVSNEILTNDPTEIRVSDSGQTQAVESASNIQPVSKPEFDHVIDRHPELEDGNRNIFVAHSEVSTSTSLTTDSFAAPSSAGVSWTTLSQPGLFWNALDSFQDDTNSAVTLYSIAVGTVGTASSSLIVGYVIWALRSGVMLSSLMTALPAWNLLDPLAIISVSDDDQHQDGESLADIMETEKEKLANSEN